jgi:predicted lipoprotein with Yx(FWY)xxD motif
MNTRYNFKSILKPVSLISILATLVLILTACQATPKTIQAPVVPAPSNTQVVAAASEAVINVATDPTLGQILVDGRGMTLYILTKDGPDQSNCDATCLAKWPPLLTQGNPTLGPGVDDSKIGSAMLADGTRIVTYDHRPLYYWINDSQPGETTGQGVGSVWFVISPDGNPVGVAEAAGSTSTPAAVVSEPTINVATDPTLGQILVDGKGMTLYIFTNDVRDQSNCDAACLAHWPPLLTQGNPTLGAGIDASKVGSAMLTDGTKIVTYDHRPLYYFVNDTKPGDTTGQGVGSVWFVISPSGQEIDGSAQATAYPAPATAATFAEPTINVATDPTLGQILVDGRGMTLYIFTQDAPDQSNCSATCLANWPPLLTQGNPTLGAGVDDSKIGSTLLADGTRIVTYNHMPLYYFIHDANPGETNGQGVGSVWYVVNPDGEIIGK